MSPWQRQLSMKAEGSGKAWVEAMVRRPQDQRLPGALRVKVKFSDRSKSPLWCGPHMPLQLHPNLVSHAALLPPHQVSSRPPYLTHSLRPHACPMFFLLHRRLLPLPSLVKSPTSFSAYSRLPLRETFPPSPNCDRP